MGPTWGPPGSCRPQIGPMSAPWTLQSGDIVDTVWCHNNIIWMHQSHLTDINLILDHSCRTRHAHMFQLSYHRNLYDFPVGWAYYIIWPHKDACCDQWMKIREWPVPKPYNVPTTQITLNADLSHYTISWISTIWCEQYHIQNHNFVLCCFCILFFLYQFNQWRKMFGWYYNIFRLSIWNKLVIYNTEKNTAIFCKIYQPFWVTSFSQLSVIQDHW